jgi:lysophospholipase L1-like esterase
MITFVALGDSITLGIGDPVRLDPAPDEHGGWRRRSGRGVRGWRGWAALLAEGLPDSALHIVAGNGACMADLERDQLPRALHLRPDIASVVIGVNDTLRPNFDLDRIAAAAAHTVGALRAAGADVLTMRLPDPGRMLGMPGVLARPLARRAHQLNEVMDAVAERFGTLHFDAAMDAEAYDPRMWAADRLHPSERGHRLIARRFHALLEEAGRPVGLPPGSEPVNPPPSRAEQLAWMATKGTAWVARRSTDLVPSLLAMAFAEWRSSLDLDPSTAVLAESAPTAAAKSPACPARPAAVSGPEMPR